MAPLEWLGVFPLPAVVLSLSARMRVAFHGLAGGLPRRLMGLPFGKQRCRYGKCVLFQAIRILQEFGLNDYFEKDFLCVSFFRSPQGF
ncbi:hypothetical protein RF55_13476 [Lasius niger]|uniref:Secreted protein n=1 Tax=Lasius niger TaxID=67767 RepID=A0A0J7KAG6_LASNI|nr:hypothetical protein RF55_13476 [Lasius niger]